MVRLGRPTPAVVAAAALVVAACIAAVVVLVATGSNEKEPTRADYLARVDAICEAYGKRLDKIPPPTDPASPGAVYDSINAALPVLREQTSRVRALKRPRELRQKLDPFFAWTDRSLDELATARQDAHDRRLFPMVQAISRFETDRNKAKRFARSVGFRC